MEREIRAEFERQLKDFLDEREEVARNAGMMSAPKMRDPNHFEWLVRYHIQRWGYVKIVDKYRMKDPDYVRHTVPSLARYIGLRLDNRRGRPRKS